MSNHEIHRTHEKGRLWTSGPGLVIFVILEIGLFAGGLGIYLTAVREKRRRGVEE